MIPDEIRFIDGETFRIKQIEGLETLGYFNREIGEIGIRRDQSETGKHIVLVHEMIHFAAEFMIQSGIIKRQPDEAFITHVAPFLLNLLLGAGLYSGNISWEELHDFMNKARTSRKRKTRRQNKQALKYGVAAKPTHKRKGGRTGSSRPSGAEA